MEDKLNYYRIVSKDNKPKYCSECGRYIDWDEAVHGMQNLVCSR